MVDCRRILKWTYAYGYYRFAESAQAQISAQASAAAEALRQQQEFFEFNQVCSLHSERHKHCLVARIDEAHAVSEHRSTCSDAGERVGVLCLLWDLIYCPR